MGLIRAASSAAFRRNYIINGDFVCALRQPANFYGTIDRWISHPGGGSGARSLARGNLTPGEISGNSGSPTNSLVHQQTNAASTTQPRIMQLVERVATLNGQSVTLSGWMFADTSMTVNVSLRQHFGTGGSPSTNVDVAAQNLSLSVGWNRFELTFAVPSISGKTIGSSGTDHLAVRFLLPLGATFFVGLADVQLQEGTSATDYVRPPYSETLRQCHRYFQEVLLSAGGAGSAGSNEYTQLTLPEALRASPTISATSISAINASATTAVGISVTTTDIWIAYESRAVTAAGGFFYQTRARLDAELLEA